MSTANIHVNRTGRPRPGWQRWAVLAALLLATGLLTVASVWSYNGRALSPKSTAAFAVRYLFNTPKALWNSARERAGSGDYRNVVFLHHSVGAALVEQGGLGRILVDDGYTFWDHGYNKQGLRGPDGQFTGYNYAVPADSTDPDSLSRVFQQPVLPLPLNTISGLMQHDVIVIKSCFPNNNIADEARYKQLQEWYLPLRDLADRHPDKLFILLTQPPLNPAETNPTMAANARRLAGWMASDEYLEGRANLVTFDLFDVLAESDPTAPDYNMLRADYRWASDSHPNEAGNLAAAPLIAQFIEQAAETYRANH